MVSSKVSEEGGQHTAFLKVFKCFAINQSDQTGDFFQEQVRQLQSQGHSPEAAAKIVVEAMRAPPPGPSGHLLPEEY